MGWIKRSLGKSGKDVMEGRHTCVFQTMTDEELARHLKIDRYGDFQLTDAVRPSPNPKHPPKTGFRYDDYREEYSGEEVSVLMISASKEILFDLFMELLDLFPGDTADVVLETSHSNSGGHDDLYRECIDLPVLKSSLLDFENLLLNDGCVGIAIMDPATPLELKFDDHKLLIIYNWTLAKGKILSALKRYNVKKDAQMKFIIDDEHVHSSTDAYMAKFDELKATLGVIEY